MLGRTLLFCFGLMWVVEGVSLRSEIVGTLKKDKFIWDDDWADPVEKFETLLPEDKKGEVAELKKCYSEKSCTTATLEDLSKSLPQLIVDLKESGGDPVDVFVAASGLVAGICSLFPQTAAVGALIGLTGGLVSALFSSKSQPAPVTLASFQKAMASIITDAMDKEEVKNAGYLELNDAISSLLSAESKLRSMFEIVQDDGGTVTKEHVNCFMGNKCISGSVVPTFTSVSDHIIDAESKLTTAAMNFDSFVNKLLASSESDDQNARKQAMGFMCTARDVKGLKSPCYHHIAHPDLYMWDCNEDMTECKLKEDAFSKTFLKKFTLNDAWTPCGEYQHVSAGNRGVKSDHLGTFDEHYTEDTWNQKIDTNCRDRLKEINSCVDQFRSGGGTQKQLVRYAASLYKSVVLRFVMLVVSAISQTDLEVQKMAHVALGISYKSSNLINVSLKNGCDMNFEAKSVYNTPRASKVHDKWEEGRDCWDPQWASSNKAEALCKVMDFADRGVHGYLVRGSWLDYNPMHFSKVFNFSQS